MILSGKNENYFSFLDAPADYFVISERLIFKLEVRKPNIQQLIFNKKYEKYNNTVQKVMFTVDFGQFIYQCRINEIVYLFRNILL